MPDTPNRAVGKYYMGKFNQPEEDNFDLLRLIQEWKKSMGEAKETNLERYEDILKRYQERRAGAETDISQLGQTELRAINRRFKEMRAKQRQHLVGRGLANSTVMTSLGLGAGRAQEEAIGGLKERLARMRLGILGGMEKDTLGFMERRTDNYPSLQQFQTLAQGLGEAGPQQQNISWLQKMRRDKYRNMLLSDSPQAKHYGSKYGLLTG